VATLPIPSSVDDALAALARRPGLPKSIASQIQSLGRYVIRAFGDPASRATEIAKAHLRIERCFAVIAAEPATDVDGTLAVDLRRLADVLTAAGGADAAIEAPPPATASPAPPEFPSSPFAPPPPRRVAPTALDPSALAPPPTTEPPPFAPPPSFIPPPPPPEPPPFIPPPPPEPPPSFISPPPPEPPPFVRPAPFVPPRATEPPPFIPPPPPYVPPPPPYVPPRMPAPPPPAPYAEPSPRPAVPRPWAPLPPAAPPEIVVHAFDEAAAARADRDWYWFVLEELNGLGNLLLFQRQEGETDAAARSVRRVQATLDTLGWDAAAAARETWAFVAEKLRDTEDAWGPHQVLFALEADTDRVRNWLDGLPAAMRAVIEETQLESARGTR
jgi:hypothetical protein